jgi:hypothetical protein
MSMKENVQQPLPPATGSAMHLWRCGCGRISTKPVKVINLGDGNIKVVGSCLITQKRDDRNESYHDNYAEAVSRLLVNAQRDVNEAKKKLDGAKRRLKAAQSKRMSYAASPNVES